MRILKKIILLLGSLSLLIIILISVTLFVVKHLRIREIVENEIEQSLGINVTIKEITFSPLAAQIGLKGVTIHNPDGFAGDELAYLESLHFVFDPIEVLTRKKPSIYLTTLDLKRLNIVKNKEGEINLKELIPVEDSSDEEVETPFYFEVVVLSIGQVKYTDYSGSQKTEHKYTIGIKDAVFVGMNDENAVVKMIVYKAIEHTDIGKLINMTFVPLVSAVSDTMGSAWGTAKVATKGAWEIATLPFKLIIGRQKKSNNEE